MPSFMHEGDSVSRQFIELGQADIPGVPPSGNPFEKAVEDAQKDSQEDTGVTRRTGEFIVKHAEGHPDIHDDLLRSTHPDHDGNAD